MALLKVNEGPFDRFGGRFGAIIDPTHFLGRTAFDIPYSRSFPPTNVKQDKEAYHIEMLLPGFKKSELSVTVQKGVLIVEGTKEEMVPNDDVAFIMEEFGTESFVRRFRLRDEHRFHHMEAQLEDGILKIVFYAKNDPVLTDYKKIQVAE